MLHLLLDTGVNLPDILKIVSQAGVVGLLLIILVGGFRKWWVFGWQYKEAIEQQKKIEQERDDWRNLALHGTNLAEQTVNLFRNRG
jgi:hypothetical protein